MTQESSPNQPAARGMQLDPTGVPQFDAILGGGLPRGALAIIMGPPGSGKTTLANQMAFAAARNGRRAVIFTALAEPTSKLIEHLRVYSFFDPDLVGETVQFLSLQTFLSQGMESTGEAMIAATREAGANFVVLDGFRGVRGADVDPQLARQFLYDIGTTLSLRGTTTIITSEAEPRDPAFFPESTTADVIVGLYYALHGFREARGIEISKVRGNKPLPGLHALDLTPDGIVIYPRLESRIIADGNYLERTGFDRSVDRSRSRRKTSERISFGVSEVDALMAGGVARGSSTLLAGSLGTGKTLLALQFALAGVRNRESVLYVSFRETLDQLQEKADAFALGAELRNAVAAGRQLAFTRWEPVELHPDIVAYSLLADIDRGGVRRLVIDSILEFRRAVTETSGMERNPNFIGSLLASLRRRSVSALFVAETPRVVSHELDFTADALSILAENVLHMQQIGDRGRLRRVFSVLKTRFTPFDPTPTEFLIASPEGLRFIGPLDQA